MSQRCVTREGSKTSLVVAVIIDCRVDWRPWPGRDERSLVLTYKLNGSPTGISAVTIDSDDGTAFVFAKGAKTTVVKVFAARLQEKAPIKAFVLSLIESSYSVQDTVGLILTALSNQPTGR